MYTPEWLSRAGDDLLAEWAQGSESRDPYDVLIVGSGYGGSVAAARLAGLQDEHGRPLTVCVLERGREHVPGTFPNNASELPGHVRFSRFDDPVPGGAPGGLFDVRVGEDVSVLVANGLGGGSLINAGVAAEADDEVFTRDWPRAIVEEVKSGRFKEIWYETARKELRATPAQTQDHSGKKIEKYFEFENTTQGFKPEPAQITVFYDNTHKHGCLSCGDCATGCNVGAKRTLSTTYLQQAFTRGATMYTGVTVSHVKKLPHSWEVFLALTEPTKPLQKKPLFGIRARTVILAAGTLGSTEILMRSKTHFSLSLSPRLGQRFSTNGDMISALYNADRQVNAAADETRVLGERHVGPTITGIARDARKRITFEELAIPGALRHMFEELVTTAAMADRLGRLDWQDHPAISTHDPECQNPASLQPPQSDPAAVDPKIIDGCQVLASMGDDGAEGSLQLVPGWNDKGNVDRVPGGAIRVHWPKAGEAQVFADQNEILTGFAKNGWTYLPSPLWQPIPADLSSALSGPKPTGTLFSVHPLGGCAMSDTFDHGVVDHMGRVFCGPAERDVHDGLLVLDGSIIPTALAVNPLLTITAVAERAVALYIAERKWTANDRLVERVVPAPPDTQLTADGLPKPPAPPKTGIQFSERMTGDVRFPGGAHHHAELTIVFDEVPDLARFLREPVRTVHVSGNLRVLDRDTHEELAHAPIDGRVEILVRGATNRFGRTLKAFLTYARSRGVADAIGNLQNHKFQNPFTTLRGLWDLASNVGEVRYLFYDLKLCEDLAGKVTTLLPNKTKLSGRKTLAYVYGGNPWRQLVDLPLMATVSTNDRPVALGTLSVDTGYLMQEFASRLQIAQQRDLPAAWMDLASFALFAARLILKIHFWSFRLPKYQKHNPKRDQHRLPGDLEPLYMERFVVNPGASVKEDVSLVLTRYRASQESAGPPVLLIHGLGSGGIQFATARVNPNLVRHLATDERQCDVWVAELRTSITLPSSAEQWTLDEVALGDVPRLVDFVLKKTGQRQLDVVGHCIGSAMFCTAVLAGRLHYPSGESKVRNATLLQVGPLITLSKGTRLRSVIAAPLRRFLPNGFVDFSVDDRATWVEAVIDRILNTYPYPADEAKFHKLCWKDDPHIANCNRWAGIDGLMIRHENLSDEMREHMGEILGHSSITTWAQPIQYGSIGRLTNSDGVNAYVTDDNVRNYFNFPVLFVHGRDNDVFHPLTSLRSQELLLRVHGPNFPARVRIVERYRHIDPLIGQHAYKDVFPCISEFLAAEHPLEAPAGDLVPQYFFRRPLIGPVVGWVRRDERSGQWRARVWCRLDDLRSPVSFAVVRVRTTNGGTRTYVFDPPKKGDAPGPIIVDAMDTLLWHDVDLGNAAGDATINVLSAHQGIEITREHQDAEFSAGKQMSTQKPIAIDRKAFEHDAAAFDGILDGLKESLKDGRDGDEKIACATVTVPAEDPSRTLTFALGSCRYPGWVFDRDRADATFGRLQKLIDKGQMRPDALFLVGDQIYADATAGVFDAKDRRERFYDAYREAWTAPHARQVLSHLPVYMMMDDHEVGDDWHPADFVTKDERRMRKEGLKAFRKHQWLLSPGNVDGEPRRDASGRRIFWYTFDLHGFPVFVCDDRTGRSRNRKRMLDRDQFKALATWLVASQENVGPRPKLVVSSSVVVPFLKNTQRARRSDSWDGYVHQLKLLFRVIADKGVQNVVFLCGDSHLSNCSELEVLDRGDVVARAYCVVGSPMYGPYPFANAKRTDFQEENHKTPLALGRGFTMRYTVAADSWATGDAFTLVEVDAAGQLRVTVGGTSVRFERAPSGAIGV